MVVIRNYSRQTALDDLINMCWYTLHIEVGANVILDD